MTTKFCKACETSKPIESFALGGVYNGKQYRRPKCKPCTAKDQRDRRRAAKDGLKYKAYTDRSVKRCAMCGFSCPVEELDMYFHRNKKTGKTSSYCRDCNRKRERKRYERVVNENGGTLRPYVRKQRKEKILSEDRKNIIRAKFKAWCETGEMK